MISLRIRENINKPEEKMLQDSQFYIQMMKDRDGKNNKNERKSS